MKQSTHVPPSRRGDGRCGCCQIFAHGLDSATICALFRVFQPCNARPFLRVFTTATNIRNKKDFRLFRAFCSQKKETHRRMRKQSKIPNVRNFGIIRGLDHGR